MGKIRTIELTDQQQQVWQLYLAGRIDLYFGDESTFSMNAVLPYGWALKGERVEIFPQRDKKVNLFGIFRPDNFCVTYESAVRRPMTQTQLKACLIAR